MGSNPNKHDIPQNIKEVASQLPEVNVWYRGGLSLNYLLQQDWEVNLVHRCLL